MRVGADLGEKAVLPSIKGCDSRSTDEDRQLLGSAKKHTCSAGIGKANASKVTLGGNSVAP